MLNGPLCEENLFGCVIVIENISLTEDFINKNQTEMDI